MRAEKEEQYLDPAKAPLSPNKHFSGRKHFRGKPTQKIVGDSELVQHKRENESKKSDIELSGEQPALPRRGQAPSPTLEDGFQQQTAGAVAGRVTQRLLPIAASSRSCEASASSVKGGETEVQESAPHEECSEKRELCVAQGGRSM